MVLSDRNVSESCAEEQRNCTAAGRVPEAAGDGGAVTTTVFVVVRTTVCVGPGTRVETWTVRVDDAAGPKSARATKTPPLTRTITPASDASATGCRPNPRSELN